MYAEKLRSFLRGDVARYHDAVCSDCGKEWGFDVEMRGSQASDQETVGCCEGGEIDAIYGDFTSD